MAIRERPAPANAGQPGGGAAREPDARDVWVVMPLLVPLDAAPATGEAAPAPAPPSGGAAESAPVPSAA